VFNAGKDASGEKMQQMIDAAWQAFREVGQEWEKKGWSLTRSIFFPHHFPFLLSPFLKGEAETLGIMMQRHAKTDEEASTTLSCVIQATSRP
jgi:hypothetical protein